MSVPLHAKQLAEEFGRKSAARYNRNKLLSGAAPSIYTDQKLKEILTSEFGWKNLASTQAALESAYNKGVDAVLSKKSRKSNPYRAPGKGLVLDYSDDIAGYINDAATEYYISGDWDAISNANRVKYGFAKYFAKYYTVSPRHWTKARQLKEFGSQFRHWMRSKYTQADVERIMGSTLKTRRQSNPATIIPSKFTPAKVRVDERGNVQVLLTGKGATAVVKKGNPVRGGMDDVRGVVIGGGWVEAELLTPNGTRYGNTRPFATEKEAVAWAEKQIAHARKEAGPLVKRLNYHLPWELRFT